MNDMEEMTWKALSQIKDLLNVLEDGARVESCRGDTVVLILADGSEMNVYLGPVQDLLDGLRGIGK